MFAVNDLENVVVNTVTSYRPKRCVRKINSVVAVLPSLLWGCRN